MAASGVSIGFRRRRCSLPTERWPVLTQTRQPLAPVLARNVAATGSRSHDCGSKPSPASVNPPCKTRSSRPPGAGRTISASGAQLSWRTLSRASWNSGISPTPARPGAQPYVMPVVSTRTWVRSSGSNCQSLTKIVQPSDPGICDEAGGLRAVCRLMTSSIQSTARPAGQLASL